MDLIASELQALVEFLGSEESDREKVKLTQCTLETLVRFCNYAHNQKPTIIPYTPTTQLGDTKTWTVTNSNLI